MPETISLLAAPRAGAGLLSESISPLLKPAGIEILWSVNQFPDPLQSSKDFAVLVVRNPIATISSMMNAWASRQFASRKLPGWWGDPWTFALLDDWESLAGKPLVEICTKQWAAYQSKIVANLDSRPANSWDILVFEELIREPRQTLSKLLGEDSRGLIPGSFSLPLSSGVVTPPGTQHWLALLPEIEQEYATISSSEASILERIRIKRPEFQWPALPQRQRPRRTTHSSTDTPFESQFTPGVSQLLEQSSSSIAISTYKSGHVIVARSQGGILDTEFLSVRRAMGMAVHGNRLAVGAEQSIRTFVSNPALAKAIDSPVPVHTVFTPRSETYTGDIAIHDMSYSSDGSLYFVNTRFNCLCIQDLDHSFVPVWRPRWISALVPEDRCHLNGLALKDGQPRYVTALDQSDVFDGWRARKGTGGLVIDLSNDEIVAKDLAMPHSPRWRDNALWLLESGKGALSLVDLDAGQVTEVVRLPGFTRGLAFIGKYALVGLSQVRESVFSDLPVTSTSNERNCGIWIVDTTTGRVVGVLKFSGAVQEIFDIAVLGSAWPTFVTDPDVMANNFVLAPDALNQVPDSLK